MVSYHNLSTLNVVLLLRRYPCIWSSFVQRKELIELKRELDEQAQHRIDMKKKEIAEEAQLAQWMREDNIKMKKEQAERAAKAMKETASYRAALEGQMGEAYKRGIEPDETAFERARNTRLIGELLGGDVGTTTRKGRRGSGSGPI